MANVPNLFIVGAPKSGTTALWSYLGDHPDVFMAGKEYHFFGSDLAHNQVRVPATTETYLRFFDGAAGQRYRGEASVGYLCSTGAAREIHEFSPDSRIIAILRNPVDMMHSLHSEMLFQGDEDIAEFAAALDAEHDRKEGRRIPPACQGLWTLFYRDIARYADQVERYFDVFGRQRVHVIVFDDFKADPGNSYREMLEFLELDPDARPEFPVVNANKVARSAATVKLLRRPPSAFRRVAHMVVPSQHLRRSLGRRLQSMNTVERSRDPLPPDLRRSLQIELADDVERLGTLLGRDLSAWNATPSRGQNDGTTPST